MKILLLGALTLELSIISAYFFPVPICILLKMFLIFLFVNFVFISLVKFHLIK